MVLENILDKSNKGDKIFVIKRSSGEIGLDSILVTGIVSDAAGFNIKVSPYLVSNLRGDICFGSCLGDRNLPEEYSFNSFDSEVSKKFEDHFKLIDKYNTLEASNKRISANLIKYLHNSKYNRKLTKKD